MLQARFDWAGSRTQYILYKDLTKQQRENVCTSTARNFLFST
jgi:hypothetical protein